jgi:hypothetical protein
MGETCPLCASITTRPLLASNEHAVAFFDTFPVSRGHALVVTRRHAAAAHLVRLNGALRPLFRRAWALMVAGMNQLPQAELELFLFGADRVPLDAVRPPLLDLQGGRCFYCGDVIRAHAEVDHFVPWSRYVDDGLDNLVVAHSRCNNSKRDFLAAAEHVERWTARTREQAGNLSTIARFLDWPRDDERTLAVARGVYLRLPTSVRLWSGPGQFVPCDPARIRTALA